MSKLFLRLDASTQSINAVALDMRKVVCERSINYSRELSRYGTENGVLFHLNPLIGHSSPLMWADGLVLKLSNPAKTLTQNLCGIFSRKTTPIWMDSPTATKCVEIHFRFGGIKK